MRNKRICIVGPSKSFLSGISYYTIRLANALSDTNEVSVLGIKKMLPKFLFPGKSRVDKNLTTLDYLPGINIFHGIDYDSLNSWFKARKFLKESKPDVIIFQWWTASIAHLYLILKMFNDIDTKAKIILEMHEVSDPIEEKNILLKLYSYLTGKILKQNISAFIVHSESDKKLVTERYKIIPERIQVVPHGLYDHYTKIDKEIARKKLNIKNEFVILYFGLIRPYKGVQDLIDAFDKLPHEVVLESKMLIIGELWMNPGHFNDMISNSKYRKNIVTKFEYVPDSEIPLYFSACDVVVLPYTRASQSGVAHIAMCFGKPIIVSEVGGLKESMAEYEGTRFVPPKAPDIISDAIVNIYNQKEYRDYHAPDRGWDKTSKMYLNLINNL